MAQAQKLIWHWSRGKEKPARVSPQELQLLAELGYLRPNDLLWRPGFKSWRCVDSVPGILVPPPVPGSGPSSLLPHELAMKVRASLAPSSRIYSKLRLSTFNLGAVFRSTQQHGVVAGLLLVVVFIGSLDLAMRTSIAIGTPLKVQDSELQQEPQAGRIAPDASKRLQSGLPPAPERVSVRLSENEPVAFDSVLLTQGSAPASEARAEPAPLANRETLMQGVSLRPTLVTVTQAESVPLPNSSRASLPEPQSVPLPIRNPLMSGVLFPVSLAQPESVPLPTRKPAMVYNEGADANATTSRVSRKRLRKIPMRFGSFGYNYSAQ
jgi:hypothetical protein